MRTCHVSVGHNEISPKNQGYKTGSGVFFGGMSKEADEVKQTFGDWCCQLCLACNLFIAVIHIVD